MCNLLNRSQRFIPIFMHSFGRYDSKLLLEVFGQNINFRIKPKTMVSNSQNIRTLSFNSFKMMDSIEHLPCKLSTLAVELNKPGQSHNFSIFKQSKLIKKFLPKKISKSEYNSKIKLLTSGKGVYPYYECSDGKKMKKVLNFPSIDKFYNDLTHSECSEKDYKFGKNVWKSFQCKNLYRYTQIYNHTDTLLLCEGYMEYRKFMISSFSIDPSFFMGVPSLSYTIMLRETKEKLHLLSDPEMSKFFRNAIRGGMSFISKRHAISKPSTERYEETQLKMIDCNNLYGSIFLLPLPTGDFKFLKDDEVLKVEEKLKKDKSLFLPENKGLMVECDLSYPQYLHKHHRQFPLAPEKICVEFDDLSPFLKKIYSLSQLSKFDNHNFNESKLIPHFYDRNKYTLHINNLCYYLSMGMVLKKIHRIVKFTQKPFLRGFITKLTQMRKECSVRKQDFYVRLVKLIANSVFGKFIQSPLNYTEVKICTTKIDLLKNQSSPYFIGEYIIKDDLVLVQLRPKKLLYNHPYHIGAAILDLSKLYMYYWFYQVIIPHFGEDKVQLCLHDTDSFLLEIKSRNFIKKFKNLWRMDFSNFPKDSFIYSNSNERALLYFKDEYPGESNSILEFIGLRSKLYALRTQPHDVIKSKGYNSNFAKKFLSFEKFKACHNDLTGLKLPLKSIRGYNHKLHTVYQKKNVLSCFDSKMFVRNCNIHCDFYGFHGSKDSEGLCDRCKKEAFHYPYKC